MTIDKEVRKDRFLRTSKFSVFKSELYNTLSDTDANSIMLGVDHFLHSGSRISNEYIRVY